MSEIAAFSALLLAPGPMDLAVEIAALRDGGLPLARLLLDLLAPAFADWQATLARGGFAPIRAAWMARAAKLGQTITARTGPRTRTGRFDGIDESGALVLTTAEGREVVPAADVYFAEGA